MLRKRQLCLHIHGWERNAYVAHGQSYEELAAIDIAGWEIKGALIKVRSA
jgi:hypothetical protein